MVVTNSFKIGLPILSKSELANLCDVMSYLFI